MKRIDFSPELEQMVRAHWKSMGNHDLEPNSDKAMWEMLDERRAEETLDLLSSVVPFSLKGCRLLEIGCGLGATQVAAHRRGIRAAGIEPGPGVHVGKRLLLERGFSGDNIISAAAEELPFRDECFDVVCSFQVLEHTRSPETALGETFRVLRVGGYFVHVFPNFGSFWEGHYGLPWLPHTPKTVGRAYLRCLHRDLSLFEELQLLSHQGVAKILRSYPFIEIENWGVHLWEHRVRTLDFSEWAHLGRLKRMVRLLHRMRLVKLVIALGRIFHFETPIVLVGSKRSQA